MDENRKAIELVLELHKMIDAGRKDVDQAEEIRAQLDDIYQSGDPALLRALDNISGLLSQDRKRKGGTKSRTITVADLVDQTLLSGSMHQPFLYCPVATTPQVQTGLTTSTRDPTTSSTAATSR